MAQGIKQISIEDVYNTLVNLNENLVKKIDGVQQNIESKINKLETKLETKFNEVEQKLNIVEQENIILREKLKIIKKRLKVKNLVFYGIGEENENNKNTLKALLNLINNTLGISDFKPIEITNVFRRGKKLHTQRPRPIFAEFLSVQGKNSIISKRILLKGSNIFIAEELDSEERKERRELQKALKEIRQSNQQAYLKGKELIIEGAAFSYTDILNNKHLDIDISDFSPPLPRFINSEPSTATITEGKESKGDQEKEVKHSDKKQLTKNTEVTNEKVLTLDTIETEQSEVEAEKRTRYQETPSKYTGILPTNQEQDQVPIHQSQPSQKKSSKNFFQTLFCCLGRKKSKSKNQEQYIDGSRYTDRNKCTYLLPPVRHQDVYKKCMVIDLDETLVHSSFKPISNADFVVPVEIDGTVHQVYVLKRPHVDDFLKRMGELYECVLFTASLAKYADPVADLLDQWGVFRARLFRESCVFYRGNYVKDLNKLGRELQQIVIVDNSPASYIFHPDNAVPVASWFDDMGDSELLDLIPFFEKLSKMENVYTVLCNSNHPYNNTNSQSNGLTATIRNNSPPDV